MWSALAEQGYAHATIFDNIGNTIAQVPVDRAEALWHDEASLRRGPYAYWDALVAHTDDATGLDVCHQFVPCR